MKLLILGFILGVAVTTLVRLGLLYRYLRKMWERM